MQYWLKKHNSPPKNKPENKPGVGAYNPIPVEYPTF